jgi:hypothetical protein
VINDDKNEKEKDDATPHDAKCITAKQEYHVLVESPLHLRPKHRQRKNKAGDAVNIPDDPKNADNDVTEIPWVGKGKVCLSVIYINWYTDLLTLPAAMQVL